MIVELGYRVTEIIAQMEYSKYDVERSLDDSEGQNDDHNTKECREEHDSA